MWKCGSGLFSFRKRYHRRGNLEYIDQSHTNLTVVPEEILRHHNTLEELSLEANQLADLPKGLFKLTKLRKLILADNEIQDLTNDIGDLTNLEELDISKNDFQVIPDTIQKCTRLQVLDISSNTLGEVPDAITKLPQLTRWITNDIALNEIPPEIGSLSNLVVLELRENCIKFLPLSFSFLSNLRQLDLGGNELEELPDTIGQLTSLVELWLDNNLLSILPAEIGDLSALQCLDVSENRIEELPEEISGLHALTDLHCTANNLHEIPQGIGTLSKLQILKLDQNELDEVTENIGGCSALLELVLTENVIEFLPSTIGKLTNLSLLNIDSNRLYTFPPEIGQCAKLSVLSARENQLSKIPKEIGNCRCLTVLALSGNKLENLPLAVSSLPLKALWLSQNQSQSVLKLQVEDDDSSKEKVLTCFLFPQEKLKAQSIDDLHYLENVEDDNNWEHIEKPSVIQFDEDDEHPKESHLQRHDTPYPKGLRERHPHLIAPRKRTESGGSIHSDGGHPRSTSPPPHGQHHAHHAFDKAPLPKQKLGVSLDENTLIIGTPGAAFVNPLMADENDNNENEQEEEEEDEEEEESSANESTSDEDEEEDEDGEKRIRFNVASPKKETRNFDDDGTCKLHRIDTPHYLKDKRIVQNTENSLQLKDLLSTIQIRKESQEESASGIMANSQVTQLENGENDTSGAWQPVIAERNLGNIFNDSVDGQPRDDDDGESTPTYRTEDETFTKVYEELSATLERDGDSLGINIAGGQGTNTFQEDEELLLTGSHVALFEDEGVFITKIAEDGPASRDGVLKVGDKIIKVNETDISEFRHDEAVNELRDSGSTVELVVLREVTDQDQIELALNSQRERNVTFASEPEVEDIEIETLTIKALLKRDERGLGFSIAGGKAEPLFKGKTEEGVYISKITENGPAALDNRLQCGDRLLFINGVDVRLSKHGDVVKALTSGGEKVSIIASREKVIQKKMKPLSQINGGDVRSTGQSTKAETIDADDDREEPKLLVEEIVLKKSAGPLGMSIVGGSDHASHPFGVNEPGIFVSKVMKTGEAAKTNLCVGDRILRVNEQDMRTASHQEAVSALVSNEPQIRLLVRHDPPPPGIQEISITKKLGEKLGISIRGGAKGHPGNPFDKEDEGIFVSKVNPSGAAARDGRLRVGMRILEVNNTSLLGATHVDAVRALRIAGDNLTSIVCDGYDEQAANELNPQQDVFFNPAVCEPPRFSPDSFSSATSGDSCYSEGWNGKSFNDSRLDESLTEQNIEKLNNSEYDADKRAQKTNENNQVEELVGSVV